MYVAEKNVSTQKGSFWLLQHIKAQNIEIVFFVFLKSTTPQKRSQNESRVCQKLMCQPGNPLTCKSVRESECGGGQIPLETEWEGGEVKGVASWYYMCMCVVFVVV